MARQVSLLLMISIVLFIGSSSALAQDGEDTSCDLDALAAALGSWDVILPTDAATTSQVDQLVQGGTALFTSPPAGQAFGISAVQLPLNPTPATLEPSMLAFLTGNVQVTAGASTSGTPANPVEVTANGNANLRGSPSTEAAVVGTTQAGQTLYLTGVNAAGDWYFSAGALGWIRGDLVTGDAGALLGLPVVPDDAASRVIQQSLDLTVTFGDPFQAGGCTVPNSVLLSAPGDQETRFKLNGLDASLMGDILLTGNNSAAGSPQVFITLLSGNFLAQTEPPATLSQIGNLTGIALQPGASQWGSIITSEVERALAVADGAVSCTITREAFLRETFSRLADFWARDPCFGLPPLDPGQEAVAEMVQAAAPEATTAAPAGDGAAGGETVSSDMQYGISIPILDPANPFPLWVSCTTGERAAQQPGFGFRALHVSNDEIQNVVFTLLTADGFQAAVQDYPNPLQVQVFTLFPTGFAMFGLDIEGGVAGQRGQYTADLRSLAPNTQDKVGVAPDIGALQFTTLPDVFVVAGTLIDPTLGICQNFPFTLRPGVDISVSGGKIPADLPVLSAQGVVTGEPDVPGLEAEGETAELSVSDPGDDLVECPSGEAPSETVPEEARPGDITEAGWRLDSAGPLVSLGYPKWSYVSFDEDFAAQVLAGQRDLTLTVTHLRADGTTSRIYRLEYRMGDAATVEVSVDGGLTFQKVDLELVQYGMFLLDSDGMIRFPAEGDMVGLSAHTESTATPQIFDFVPNGGSERCAEVM